MTPEQETRELLTRVNLAIAKLDVASDQLVEAAKVVRHLGTSVAGIAERQNVLERSFRELRPWMRKKLRETFGAPRERMPTLGPDDSGSIELGALGMRANFTGPIGLRIAAVALAVLAFIGGEYFFHVTLAKAAEGPTQHEEHRGP